DPRIRFISYGPPQIDVARDELGHDLPARPALGRPDVQQSLGTNAWQMFQRVTFDLPANAGSHIALLRGYFPVMAVIKSQVIEFDHVMDLKPPKVLSKDSDDWTVE